MTLAAATHCCREERDVVLMSGVAQTGTVTVPAGTDPKLILEMFDRQRTPLAVPVPPAPAPTETH